MKRTLILVALCAAALAASVTAAQAGVLTNTTVSYAYSGFVPCANGGAGELVTGTIEAHILETSTSNGKVDVSHLTWDAHGSLTGSITGDTYRLGGVTHSVDVEHLASDRYTLTYINRYRLIAPGPGNNLVVRETAHVTADGDNVIVDHDEFSIECS